MNILEYPSLQKICIRCYGFLIKNKQITSHYLVQCDKIEQRYCYCDRCGGAPLHLDWSWLAM